MGLALWLILSAFVVGALARFAVPGPDPMPAWMTVLIGLGGTAGGWGLVYWAGGAGKSWAGIASYLIAIALVLAYRRFVQKRALWGPEAFRFPQRGVGVEEYRERLSRAGIDPDAIGPPFAAPLGTQPAPAAARPQGDDPTENPAHYLGLLEELHDHGVITDEEYGSARTRLLERLRA